MAKIYKNYFDVVILSPREVRDYTIGVSKRFKKYGTKWDIGKTSYLPHLSLYHIAVKPKDFNKFITTLKKVIKSKDLGSLKLTKIKMASMLLLMTDKPDWLKKLQSRVLKDCLKYYDWDYSTDKIWNIDQFPKPMRERGRAYIKKYGTPLVGKNFNPHFTLTKFLNKPLNFSKAELRVQKLKFEPGGVFVCELGESHTCQRIVSRII